MYKEFIKEKEFSGVLGKLAEDIVEAFVNEEICMSELGEFYNIAGDVKIEEYGDFSFNEGITTGIDGVELDMGGILEEEIIKGVIINHFIYGVRHKNIELDIDGKIEELRLDSKIKATYTLAYS